MGTVLVTGAAGYLGSHLAEALVARGEQVVALDNYDPAYPRETKLRNLSRLQGQDGFTLVEGDVRCPDTVARVMAEHRPDRIVHLAAKAGVRESIRNPDGYMSTNVEGTLRVLQAACEAGVSKLVFSSSSSVYGPFAPVPFREDQALSHPASPYAASKIAAEAYCHVYHHLHGLPVVIARVFNPVGPRQRPGMALEKFTRLMLAGQPIPVFGDGSTRRDYTYVGDTVAGLLAALDADLEFEIINLGHSQPIALRDLIAMLEQVLGVQATIERLPEQPGDVPCTYADIDRARRLLGWEPETSVEEAVARFVRWYRDGEDR